MKTKNIFKAMALAMLMPAMLLTTACSSDDNTAIDNEQTIKKGFELPVTVNVTRQGDDAASSPTNRASYNGTSKKLEFSTGDQLFVTGWDKTDVGGAGYYAGTLTWQSGGTFTGTIFTEHGYTGTADELFSATYLSGGYLTADLLPAGDYGYFSITNSGTYYATISPVDTKAFATSKAVAVEQFSFEHAEYSSGFALSPLNAILNFTITGLPASTNVNATLTKSPTSSVSGNVTTDGSGTATFAMAVRGGSYNINELTLTVGGNDITFTGSDVALAKGHIYNITRSTGATVNLSTINADYPAQNGETLTGTLGANVKISIADGATVILNNVNINGSGTWTSGNYAGITCEGDATIILSGTNTVKGFESHYPGIYVQENKTVTIQGTGSLTASSNGWAAGIGGGSGACGNITINGGNITATGGNGRAGIGGGTGACGNITITGGTITATGGNFAAGIGGSNTGNCGNITITSGVTRVTATKGNNAPNSIGAGGTGTCGTVMFGTQTMYNGSSWTTTPTSGSTYGGLSLTISQTTYANDTWTLTPVLP